MLGRAHRSSRTMPGYLDEAIGILTTALGADQAPVARRGRRLAGLVSAGRGLLAQGQRWRRPCSPRRASTSTRATPRTSATPRSMPSAPRRKFARGSRGWLIAEDIITYKNPRPEPGAASDGQTNGRKPMPAKYASLACQPPSTLQEGGSAACAGDPAARRDARRRAEHAAARAGGQAAHADPRRRRRHRPTASAPPAEARTVGRLHAGPAQGDRGHHQGLSC